MWGIQKITIIANIYYEMLWIKCKTITDRKIIIAINNIKSQSTPILSSLNCSNYFLSHQRNFEIGRSNLLSLSSKNVWLIH